MLVVVVIELGDIVVDVRWQVRAYVVAATAPLVIFDTVVLLEAYQVVREALKRKKEKKKKRKKEKKKKRKKEKEKRKKKIVFNSL